MTALNSSLLVQPAYPKCDVLGGAGPERVEIARFLQAAVTDCGKAIELLDSTQQSEVAGRLHTLRVELRELAGQAVN